ncbi:MAG: minichromosome maintenance protein MCM [Euryarchaeota archaeon]|nr:minichromosome maintenance protein MCM [Euryarchaeota archaeon]
MEAAIETIDFQDAVAKFDGFFRRYYYRDILRIVHEYPEKKSLYVDFNDLDRYDIALADSVLTDPDTAIRAAERAVSEMETATDAPGGKINVRFTDIPESHRYMIKDIRSADVGILLSVTGIVRKATDVRPKLVEGAYECQRCGDIMRIPQDGEKLKEPYLCESCEKKGPFKLLIDESKFIDSQKIQIQESLEALRGGEHPKELAIYLEDDLTGRITPGDRIEVVGILRAVRKKVGSEKLRVFEIFIEANSFQVQQSDFEEVSLDREDVDEIIRLSKDPEIYEMIKDSIAPHILGYQDIKEAIMYQLFSSPPLELPDGGRVRGDSHIILVGDPSTGKSEILQYVARELAPRGVYASGKGTSTAGLTAAAVKDEFGDGGWSLEAGALVLADRGIACIDEFDKMEKDDRSAMHEAMEQQTVSIAKAGILATFQARCSILAAANPKLGRFDEYKTISEQINLQPTILSRFDLIFIVKDEPENTRQVTKHILDTVMAPQSVTPKLDPELLRKYIAYARKNVQPELSDKARKAIEDFYNELRERALSQDIGIPLTARQLWAIIRLARASARVRLSETVEVKDAENAIRLLELSLNQVGRDETGNYDVDKIMVGVTKSQRDKINEILDIIKELEKDYGTARIEEIIELARERNIDEKNTRELIEKLRKDGNIYEPRHGNYKVV